MSLDISQETDPFAFFCEWFKEAAHSELEASNNVESNAMVLSTSSLCGKVSSRVVLLKSYSAEKFVFFTNYESSKARDLQENPYACLLFHWQGLNRQIRISGTVSRESSSVSDKYFASRSREAQLGAWVSRQSCHLSSREELLSRVKTMSQRFSNKPIPRPDFWGGMAVLPQRYEFWQGYDSSRLHDRVVFAKTPTEGKSEGKSKKFSFVRLFP